MDEGMAVNLRKQPFVVGDKALLKADFDMNIKTKKRKLNGFFEAEVEVVTVLANNRYTVRKQDGSELCARITQLRKIYTTA